MLLLDTCVGGSWCFIGFCYDAWVHWCWFGCIVILGLCAGFGGFALLLVNFLQLRFACFVVCFGWLLAVVVCWLLDYVVAIIYCDLVGFGFTVDFGVLLICLFVVFLGVVFCGYIGFCCVVTCWGGCRVAFDYLFVIG